ncbi:MAG: KpsF/GutQ family sugar-phosphate isomerase [Acidobacteriia bacterium]|nr:KpsF/GutQ family sugar-phosphate isomerase [Terriglobia bacterium]
MSIESARRFLAIEAEAIMELIARLDRSFTQAVDLIEACKGRVVITGIGKSGIIAQKISATLSSTGTPSLFLHPAEAVHGDLGRMVAGDLVLALSYSGETEEILLLLDTLKRLGIPLIAMSGSLDSTLAEASDVVLDVSIKKEACPLGLAPTASTTAMLALGDALALAVLERRGFTEEDFAALHPAGGLGRKLMRVENLMHSGDALPKVKADTRMSEVIYEISKKGLGMTSVVDGDDHLVGIITDGDLRRLLERGDQILSKTAGEAMHPRPLTIHRREFATHALNLMEQQKITSLIIVNETRCVEGVLHIHDLWRTEMF